MSYEIERPQNKLAIPLEYDRGRLDIDPVTAVLSTKQEKEFVRILADYEAILSRSHTAQEVVDNTNQFVKSIKKPDCTCVRSAENGDELVFKTVDCRRANNENRAYKLDAPTIITRAARSGVSILETDQGDHKENGRPETDKGALMTMVLPLSESYSPRLQLTTCDPKAGLFDTFQATIEYFILRRMSDAYTARRYGALHPIITQSASKLDPTSRHRIFGSYLFESELGELINGLQIDHNNAYLIDNISAWPKFLHTEGVVTNNTVGPRPLQQQVLERVQAREQGFEMIREGVYVRRENDKLKLRRGVNPYVDELEVTASWPHDLSVIVVPLTIEAEFLGYLWLERQDEPFTLEDLKKLEQGIIKEPGEILVKAVEKVGRPRVHFVALPSNPKIKDVLDKISLAIQEPSARVLLVGETGTGKELVARIIHDETRALPGRYVAIDPASAGAKEFSSLLLGRGPAGDSKSVSGFLRMAARGTLILDQLEKFSKDGRNALLRPLDENEYQPLEVAEKETLSARVIGIVTGDLDRLLSEGALTQELINRLGSIKIQMPPLRERKEEIEAIIEHWLRIGELSHFEGKYVHKSIIDLFKNYAWPGNLRELRNVVEAMCRAAGPDVSELTDDHLEPTLLAKLKEGNASESPVA